MNHTSYEYDALASKLTELLRAHERQVRTCIDAGLCGTRTDYKRARTAEADYFREQTSFENELRAIFGLAPVEYEEESP